MTQPDGSKSRRSDKSARTLAVNETIQAFLQFVLSQKFADMPNWLETDLTVSQLRAIYYLVLRGPLTVGELARLLDMRSPAASILVQQLVEQSLVERSEDSADRRRTLVRPTARGTELVGARADLREAKFRRWLGELDDDALTGLRQGITALVKVIQANKP